MWFQKNCLNAKGENTKYVLIFKYILENLSRKKAASGYKRKINNSETFEIVLRILQIMWITRITYESLLRIQGNIFTF